LGGERGKLKKKKRVSKKFKKILGPPSESPKIEICKRKRW
jgi:hypothetical protein